MGIDGCWPCGHGSQLRRGSGVWHLMAGETVRYKVLLTQGAEKDLEAIDDDTADLNCAVNTNSVFEELMAVGVSLSKLPERGRRSKGLISLCTKDYQQTFLSRTVRSAVF